MTEEHQEHNQPNQLEEANTATRQGEGEQSEAPEGAAPASDLFDLMGASGEQFKKLEKKTEAKEKNQKKATGQATSAARKKYPQGMEIHHAGHKLTLPKEMTEAEVFTFLADDFPEVTADRAEIREDKQKDRLVVAFKSFKKG